MFFKKNIKKLILLLFLVLCSYATVFSAESRLDKIQKNGKIRIGVTGDFNPMNFIDPSTKEYNGFDIDLVKELAKDMKVEVEFVKTDWKTLINGILADKYDISCSASLNPGRALVAGYTIPYVDVKTVPVTQKSKLSKFNSWEQLNNPNVKIATTLGTVFEDEAKQYFPKSKLVSVEPPARDYQEVLSGRADASITSNLEAAGLIKTHKNLAIVKLDEARNRKPLALLVDKEDQVWINFLNHWITFKESQGFMTNLRSKWLNE